ncbi:MAG: site-specific DNA-methyltransferase [Bosea sp.]|uniref:site-specific DNA-methyltransferase n=1 Tax=Bosea sp. (in: a-proteobacteria) TaxID=1871050 RepID=UPI001ACB404F|nr:site-specific DNA-methyltransferase [Bosea sp. (in: a-proteobacteria)]MBN9454009.1 site-specific DNA-methyltransferase [Bosea sp. (in: a-proteobacteria)]
MAKSPKPTDVDHFAHGGAKRYNIPTAENQGLVPDDDKAVKVLRYPRNPDLDPQLVWRGKDAEDAGDLEVAAPPVFIQEKIHPRALIENLRKQSKARRNDAAPQIDFFHDFNGLPESWKEDATESYYHDEGKWSNRMILGDSLLVMGSLAEREKLRGKVQCIYFDPPYGIKFNSNWQPSTKNRKVDEGKSASVSREPEVVRAFRDTWNDGIHSYLSYLRDRVQACRELLTESGSFFVQIGVENSHLVRSICDEVFRQENYISEISIQKTGSQSGDFIQSNHDIIIWYARNKEHAKSYYKSIFLERDGKPSPDDLKKNTLDRDDFGAYPLTSDGYRETTTVDFNHENQKFHPGAGRHWGVTVPELERVARAGRIVKQDKQVRLRYFWDDYPVMSLGSYWNDVGGASGKVYVVQTTPKVIERCLLMTTRPGDLVMDPTCGSGTTAFVAEQWGRRWITIDTSRVALTLARARLMGAKFDFYHLKDSKTGAAEEAKLTGRPPAEGPFIDDIRQGFVYKRVPHVTLKSIASNLEIDVIWEKFQTRMEPFRSALNSALGRKDAWEEWQVPREADTKWPAAAREAHVEWWRLRRERQAEMDASIARNADVEYLYDQPIPAKGVVRVAGPFTVESLSPHRVLPLGEDPFLAEMLGADDGADVEPEPMQEAVPPTDFAQIVYENLLASGVQNTKKGETLKFDWLKPRVSRSGLVPFEGQYLENGEVRRAGICIGPEYDTVGFDLVQRAVKEARNAFFDALIICGFAFAPEVDDTRLDFPITVLKARMNQDLRMGDKLKATGAGNLFVVFGEPDIVTRKLDGDMVQVEIRGMDIFDPTTGQVRSSRPVAEIKAAMAADPELTADQFSDIRNDVAAWFIDDDYDEDNFFVRQAYFVGDSPYEGLKRALKAEIDETAWEDMNSTISRPFARPARGSICVKVINHFGDEVQKVFVV